MKPEALGCAEVGTEARLKKSTEPGKIEVACLDRQDRACTAFRMINSAQMDNMAIEHIFNGLQSQIIEYNKTSHLSKSVSTLPAGHPLRRDINELLSVLRRTENAIELLREQTSDVRLTNGDLFNLHSCEYIEAVADRRKAWLDNSRIRLNIQRELTQLPIDIFSEIRRASGDLLGAKANTRLGQ